MRTISIKPSALRQTSWREYAVRFVFGGLVTAAAGLIANQFGPVVGGLFLAFPAIFPASVTLVEKHEDQKNKQDGVDGEAQSRDISGVVAAGTSMGALGLLAFGLVVWQLGPRMAPWLVLLLAMVVWLVVAVLVWLIRRRI